MNNQRNYTFFSFVAFQKDAETTKVSFGQNCQNTGNKSRFCVQFQDSNMEKALPEDTNHFIILIMDINGVKIAPCVSDTEEQFAITTSLLSSTESINKDCNPKRGNSDFRFRKR